MVISKDENMTPLNEDGILVPYRDGFVNLLLIENKEQCKLNFIAKFRQMNFEVETFINCSEAQKRLDEEDSPKIDFLVIDAEKFPESRKLAKVDNLPTFATFKNGALVNQTQTNKAEVLTELVNEVI